MKWALALAIALAGCEEMPSESIALPKPVDEAPESEGVDCPTAVRDGVRSFDDLLAEESAQWALLRLCIDGHVEECRGYQCVPGTEDFGSPAITAGCLQCVAPHCGIEIAFCLQP